MTQRWIVKRNAVLLWIVYFLNGIIFPSFIVEVSSEKYAVYQMYVIITSHFYGDWNLAPQNQNGAKRQRVC